MNGRTHSPLPAPLALAALLLCLMTLALPSARAEDPWSRLDAVARESVEAGDTPGVVLLVGHRGRIVYRKAFGFRSLAPQRTPMTVDTLFDLASLTKVVATTSAIMALVEEGRLRLSDPVARYWPEFAQNGKERVTLRQLLTHTSGLAAWTDYRKQFGDPNGPPVQDHRERILAALAAAPLSYPPDTRQVYSDLGFITLGEIVRRVSGEPLDRFAERRIFRPLGMRDTGFNPPPRLRLRAAPTTRYGDRFLQGEVHDPNAAVLGGVAGHAGLFSTADDLARFAAMLLSSDPDGAPADSAAPPFPLAPATVRAMTTPHTPPGVPLRGLGWDIDSPYSHVRGDLMPLGSFGHTGFTGTYLWVDPYSRTFVIGLSNRLHPDGGGNVLPLWARAANIVSSIVRPEALPPRAPVEPQPVRVLTGLDVLQRDGFRLLHGRRVGLITNPTGVNRERVSAIDLLHRAPGVTLVALFAPEHGLRADRDEPIASTRDEATGLPVYSLYERERRKPAPEQLAGIDTLVFDIQDVGVRYYTYITTMALAMQAAKEQGIRFVVLDRPNPINGLTVDGPLLEPERQSFIGWYPIPVRHGMTVGELARFFNAEFGIGCDLTVVPMEYWKRRMWWDETGLPWVNPSPNIRNARQAELYAAIGLLESANLSVGRGTDTPFERIGAPWIDGARLAAELNRRRLPGLAFIPVEFTPTTREFQGQRCSGVDIRLLDRERFDACRTAIEIMDALVRLFPDAPVRIERTRNHWGTERIPQAVLSRRPVAEIVASYREEVRNFLKRRQPYLLYR